MMQALLENYGTLLSYDGQKLYCFWEPEVIDAVTEQALRALKVGYRAKSIGCDQIWLIRFVTLSEAKGLSHAAWRFFASLRMTVSGDQLILVTPLDNGVTKSG